MAEVEKKSYLLSAEGIDKISQEFSAALTEMEVDRKDVLRLRISLEEILESWLSFLENAPVTFLTGRRMGKQVVEIRIEGREIRSDEGLENLMFSSRLLAQAGLTLVRSYKRGENCLTVNPPARQKMGQMQKLLIAILSAVVLGLLQRVFPSDVQNGIRAVTDPLFTLILNLLRSISSPMIFLAICWGIFNIGDMTVMERIGKIVIVRFIALTFLTGTLTAVGVSWLFRTELAIENTAVGGFSEIYQIVLDIVPSDIISPFLDGNTLQIIFLGAAVGIALLILGDRVSATRAVIEQMNEVVQLLMEAIGGLISVFVFFSLFGLMGSDFDSEITGIVKALIIAFGGCTLISLVFMAVLSVRYKVAFRTLIRKLLPTFLIGITTASSAAAFATNMETCEKELGIPQNLSHFAVPLGQVIFKPAAAFGFSVVCLCMAENYGVAITLPWLVTMVIVVGLLAMAAPPIPGGALTCYTVMFTQLGIPVEAVALAVAINSLIDFVMTANNLTCLQVTAVAVSGRLGMLDVRCLRNKR